MYTGEENVKVVATSPSVDVLTSSEFKPNHTLTYSITNANGEVSSSFRTVSASYYWPYTQYQLSVLRDTPTVIINLNKLDELPNGLGNRGFALIPSDTDQKVRDNLEYYMEKAGLITKTTKFKAPTKPERGGAKIGMLGLGGGGEEGERRGLLGGIAQGFPFLNKSLGDKEDQRDGFPLGRLRGKAFFERIRQEEKRKKRRWKRKKREEEERRKKKLGLFNKGIRPHREINADNPKNIKKHNHPHAHKGKHGQKRSKHKHK